MSPHLHLAEQVAVSLDLIDDCDVRSMERAVAAVVGGAKVSTKLNVLGHLLGKVDLFLELHVQQMLLTEGIEWQRQAPASRQVEQPLLRGAWTAEAALAPEVVGSSASGLPASATGGSLTRTTSVLPLTSSPLKSSHWNSGAWTP